MAGGLKLRPPLFFNNSGDLVHQIGAHSQIGRFLGGICDGIPHISVAFDLRLAHYLISHQLGEARLRGVYISLRCCLRLLLKRMEDIDHIGQAGRVVLQSLNKGLNRIAIPQRLEDKPSAPQEHYHGVYTDPKELDQIRSYTKMVCA